jgi:predicted ester cyclase
VVATAPNGEQNKALRRRLYAEVFDHGNLAAADELIAADVVDHHAPPGRQSGLEGAKQPFAMFRTRTAFPDLRANVEHLVAEGAMVVAQGTAHGTHGGAFMTVGAGPRTARP